MNSNEFIAGGCYMEVGLFLVYKKCIRYPDVLNELWTDGEGLDTLSLFVRQPWVRPELSKIEVQGEVLERVSWSD